VLDGAPGLAWASGGVPRVVFRFTCRSGRIANPEAIAGLSVRLNR
jgi:hypothetical protein